MKLEVIEVYFQVGLFLDFLIKGRPLYSYDHLYNRFSITTIIGSFVVE